jgi:hypothetical protein
LATRNFCGDQTDFSIRTYGTIAISFSLRFCHPHPFHAIINHIFQAKASGSPPVFPFSQALKYRINLGYSSLLVLRFVSKIPIK